MSEHRIFAAAGDGAGHMDAVLHGQFAGGIIILHGDHAGKVHSFPDHVQQQVILHEECPVLVRAGDEGHISGGIIEAQRRIVTVIDPNGKRVLIDLEQTAGFQGNIPHKTVFTDNDMLVFVCSQCHFRKVHGVVECAVPVPVKHIERFVRIGGDIDRQLLAGRHGIDIVSVFEALIRFRQGPQISFFCMDREAVFHPVEISRTQDLISPDPLIHQKIELEYRIF